MTDSQTYFVVNTGTQVLVADKNLQLHDHRMQHSRTFRADSRIPAIEAGLMFQGVGSTRTWSPAGLGNLNYWVFVTGHSKWPYLIVRVNHLHTDKTAAATLGP